MGAPWQSEQRCRSGGSTASDWFLHKVYKAVNAMLRVYNAMLASVCATFLKSVNVTIQNAQTSQHVLGVVFCQKNLFFQMPKQNETECAKDSPGIVYVSRWGGCCRGNEATV